MSAYVVLFRESEVRDPERMKQYQSEPRAADRAYAMKPLVVYGKQIAIEGEAPDGVVILEFPTMEEAQAWYHGPGYQSVVGHRLAAADYRGVIVEGFMPPTQ